MTGCIGRDCHGAAKLFFSDVGVVNQLARRGRLERRSALFGKAFENWVFHELTAWNAYGERNAMISHWRLASGIEVDFIVNDMHVAIEAKASHKITSDHLKGLRQLGADHPEAARRLVVCLEPRSRTTEDGIEILPANDFARRLTNGEVF
ncbi:MAG: DUF4143 domain-containing protein [Vicinamibacterales bacterium]|nr:DUF4143 domain-containing protein [Vicinamibacterales bacterium]